MSLFREIKESAEGRELSLRWYRNKIRSLKGERITVRQHIREGTSSALVEFGKMNMFSYSPKTAERLKYYDIFPLVLPFKRHRNGFTAINFHYLPIPLRVKLLERLDIVADEDAQTIPVMWQEIRSIRLVPPIVRRYDRKQVRSMFLHIPLDDMYIGALLPVQQFYKGESTHRRPVSDRSVWHDTRRMING